VVDTVGVFGEYDVAGIDAEVDTIAAIRRLDRKKAGSVCDVVRLEGILGDAWLGVGQHTDRVDDLRCSRYAVLHGFSQETFAGFGVGIGLHGNISFASSQRFSVVWIVGIVSVAIAESVARGGEFDLNPPEVSVIVVVGRSVGESVIVGAVVDRARYGL